MFTTNQQMWNEFQGFLTYFEAFRSCSGILKILQNSKLISYLSGWFGSCSAWEQYHKMEL